LDVHQVDCLGQKIDVTEGQTCQDILSQAVSGKKLKQTVACQCDDRLIDLTAKVPTDCHQLEPILVNTDQGLEILRHSAAHVMAEAVKKLFPTAKVTIGPAIENGFYYDFDFERSFTPDDLESIEQQMAKSVAADESFRRDVLLREEARKFFSRQNEIYKLEILDDMDETQVSLYTHNDFTDLCRGPHVPSTGFIQAFKLTSVAGAYWRGDENRPMLQRIYGTAFADHKSLKKYLAHLEEAKKRDHRRLGPQLDLFSFSDEVGPGMPIFHPNGALVRAILEDFETKEHLRRGYQLVRGPQLLRRELWQKSGHYQNYGHNMYFSEIDEQVYGLKPMNCVAHMLIYKSSLRSYRDLPIRYFELGTVHRHEKSGVLHGLLRVRQFTQDDAHIICRPEQLQNEITGIISFVQDVMSVFGFEFEVELSTRPEKSIGSDEDWDRATSALHQALDSMGLAYDINAGDGAFYGPKIDVKLKDALDRTWQCATIQCDFTLPHRFDLSYIGSDGDKHRPVMVHRTIVGAIERFMGVLIEHFAGALPTWLAPVQAMLVTVTDAQNDFARQCVDELGQAGIRAKTDLRNEKLGLKVREAQLSKIPYILVIGDREVQDQMVNIRFRNGQQAGAQTISETAAMIQEDCQEPFKRGGMRYSFTN
jgi:threonyl-tRNA synthetase